MIPNWPELKCRLLNRAKEENAGSHIEISSPLTMPISQVHPSGMLSVQLFLCYKMFFSKQNLTKGLPKTYATLLFLSTGILNFCTKNESYIVMIKCYLMPRLKSCLSSCMHIKLVKSPFYPPRYPGTTS